MVLHRLTQSNPEQISEQPIYVPDGDTGMPLALNSKNMVSASEAAADLDSAFYGLTVTNNSGRDPFPYLIYFDSSDYSILT